MDFVFMWATEMSLQISKWQSKCLFILYRFYLFDFTKLDILACLSPYVPEESKCNIHEAKF